MDQVKEENKSLQSQLNQVKQDMDQVKEEKRVLELKLEKQRVSLTARLNANCNRWDQQYRNEIFDTVEEITILGKEVSLDVIIERAFQYVRGNGIVATLFQDVNNFNSKSRDVLQIVAQRVKDYINTL